MSNTTQPTTFSDLIQDLVSRVREQSGVTATTLQLKRYINTALEDFHLGGAEKFPWTERRSTITTHPRYSTGTLSATQGSATITGSGTAWNTANAHGQTNVRAGGKMTISGQQEVYTVATVTNDTSATLSPSYIGTTDTGLSYAYFEDEYSLAADFAKPLDQRSFDTGREIKLIGRQDFRRMYPRNRVPNTRIRHATLLDLPPSGDTVPIRKVQFAPPPSEAQIVPYSYVTRHLVTSALGVAAEQFSADTDEPLMPLRFRHAIVLHALYNWYRDRKDDVRSQEAKGEYEQLRMRILADLDIGQQRPRVTVRVQGSRENARRPWRGQTRRFDRGRFDEMGE